MFCMFRSRPSSLLQPTICAMPSTMATSPTMASGAWLSSTSTTCATSRLLTSRPTTVCLALWSLCPLVSGEKLCIDEKSEIAFTLVGTNVSVWLGSDCDLSMLSVMDLMLIGWLPFRAIPVTVLSWICCMYLLWTQIWIYRHFSTYN